MKLVVGLGNPGPGYAQTRHNAGFRVVERFAARHGIALDRERFEGRLGLGSACGLRTAVLEPLTWMNLAGDSVARALGGLAGLEPREPLDPERDLVVVFDDLDLPFGRLRLRPGGGAGGHRGLTSVIERLGTQRFARLRFGIGRPPPGCDPVDYVLAPFDAGERSELPGRIEGAADALDAWLAEGVEAAMNRVNREPAAPAAEGGGA